MLPANRFSSSSEEYQELNQTAHLDLSDVENELSVHDVVSSVASNKFVSDLISEYRRRSGEGGKGREYAHEYSEQRLDSPVPQSGGAVRALEAIRDAEASKVKIYKVSGKSVKDQNIEHQRVNDGEQSNTVDKLSKVFTHSMLVDETYQMVAAHVDSSTKIKIEQGKYVDFAKIIPKGRLRDAEDTRMEMINKRGQSYWVPVQDREVTLINSLTKWEQAFRVYAEIYCNKHPRRATELIQYNHVISTAARSYTWKRCIDMTENSKLIWWCTLHAAGQLFYNKPMLCVCEIGIYLCIRKLKRMGK